MKSTDIPNGFVVIGQMGSPVLVDYDDNGNPIESGTELKSSGWLAKENMAPSMLALVHTVKGREEMLIRALLVVRLNDLDTGRIVTAVQLGKANKLFSVAKNIRDKYVEELNLREKKPNTPRPKEYKLMDGDIAKASKS
jgi:hypothetical protein